MQYFVLYFTEGVKYNNLPVATSYSKNCCLNFEVISIKFELLRRKSFIQIIYYKKLYKLLQFYSLKKSVYGWKFILKIKKFK